MATEMRAALATTLASMMRDDESIVVVNADLSGALGTAALKKEFPDRTFNVGVQEANMAGFAAGLAAYGFNPFIFSFTAFATRRMADQFAISIAYGHNNVRVVGGDPGIGAQLNGGTHMSFADLAIVRSIPGLAVVEPCDSASVAALLPQIARYDGPVYLRLFRRGRPDVYDAPAQLVLGRAEVLVPGRDVTIAASGIEVVEALTAARELAGDGISAEVIDVHTLKPLDDATLIDSVRRTGAVVTCDNHNVIGALGSAVAEITAEQYPVPLVRVGVKDRFGEVGTLDYLIDRFELSSPNIVQAARRAISLKPGVPARL